MVLEKTEIMPLYTYIILTALLAVSCTASSSRDTDENASNATAESLLSQAQAAFDAEDNDSAFSLLLKAEPYIQGQASNDFAYDYYDLLARLYERKNLFDLQEQTLQKKLNATEGEEQLGKTAETCFEMGVARFAQERHQAAAESLHSAIRHASPDSIQFIAQCYVVLSQIYLQTSQIDSMENALHNAVRTDPSIAQNTVFQLAQVYMLYEKGDKKSAEEKINGYLPESDIYFKTELLNLLATIHEEQGAQQAAINDLRQVIALNDSAAQMEASENTVRIHRLRHEEQIRTAQLREERMEAEAKTRTMTLLTVIMAVVGAGAWTALWLSKKAKKARIAELQALHLAQDAQTAEEQMRLLNQELQKRYYQHLYAIILPILNAKQTKTGFIDLNDKEWKLIEDNTNLVLPGFTRKLRKDHPLLADDDIRFCCLVAMQVPNPVIANIYGIAPASVSVRKQRMKKKLDEAIANETLEKYLEKYSL